MEKFRNYLRKVKDELPKDYYDKLRKSESLEEAKDILMCRMFDGDYSPTEEWLYHLLVFEMS